MHQHFCASISRVIIPAIAIGLSIAGASPGLLSAQDQQSELKKTTEPVFRISKLTEVKNGQSSQNVLPPAAQTTTPLTNQEPKSHYNVDRIADSSTMPRSTPRITNNPVGTNVPDTNIPSVIKPMVTPVVLPSAIARPPVIPVKAAPHPLDRAVNVAEVALADMRNEVQDYTAILKKREQINGVIDEAFMSIKVRCPRTLADGTVTPFSIYMKFLQPAESRGREVIWVDGRNSSKLSVHEGKGFLRFKTFHLDPTGTLAMRGQRYPIYEAGLENLIVKLIEKAERDRAAGPCYVDYRPGEINKRPCSVIELIHEERRAPYEFHKAQVFIDNELNIPIRFEAYDWPTSPGREPQLLEEYTYLNVNVNVGLTDMDFSTKNPQYKFPPR